MYFNLKNHNSNICRFSPTSFLNVSKSKFTHHLKNTSQQVQKVFHKTNKNSRVQNQNNKQYLYDKWTQRLRINIQHNHDPNLLYKSKNNKKNLNSIQDFLKTSQKKTCNSLNFKSQTINYLKCVPLLCCGKKFGLAQFTQILGNGSNACVRLCHHGGNKYAVKIYDKKIINQPNKRKRILLQINLLGKLAPHQNIIKLYQAYQNRKYIYIIFQYIQGAVTLDQYFKQKQRKLQCQQIRNIFRGIVIGLDHIHRQGLAHRDIKTDNILLKFDQEGEVKIKIIDFGYATLMKKSDLFCGTPNYMAPQILKKQKYYPNKVDCWALGILLYYLLQGKHPFKGKDKDQLFKNINQGQLNIVSVNDQRIVDIIRLLVNKNMEQRASIRQIITNDWLN